MKQFVYLFLVTIAFLFLLCFPTESFSGATNGLLLWFQIVLPTLFPVIIVSNLLVYTNAMRYLSKLISPVTQFTFQISEPACYAVLVGFFCGYPMGAKVIADLVKNDHISRKEGEYLLSFSNNTSCVFIVNYIVMQHFQDPSLLTGTLGILLLSPIICSFLFRKYYHIRNAQDLHRQTMLKPLCFQFEIFDQSLMSGFETITKIGGYIILFSILVAWCEKLPFSWLLPTLEISSGIQMLTRSSLPFCNIFVLVLSLSSFGGFCAVAQTYSMVKEVKLPIVPYVIQKLITALVTSFLAIVYIGFIHQ